jgi:hypothetical protein
MTTTRTRESARTRYASLDAALSDMTQSHIECRDYGHSWKRHNVTWSKPERSYVRILKCTRCRTLRHDLLNSDGDPLRSHYDYADHYLIGGLGRLTGSDRSALRLANLRSALNGS